MKLFYFLLLLVIAPVTIFSQEFKDSTLVSLNNNLTKASDVHQKIEALLKMGCNPSNQSGLFNIKF